VVKAIRIFLNKELFNAIAIADLVVSRAGASSLSEFSVLAKPTILIPIPGHQEINAQHYAKQNSTRILSQKNLTKENFTRTILVLIENQGDLQNLSRNILNMIDKDAGERYVELINEVVEIK